MATKEYWADAKFERGSTLFSHYFPTLDSLISPDAPVRLIAEVLNEVDWSLWEAEYLRRKGQPRLYTRLLACSVVPQ